MCETNRNSEDTLSCWLPVDEALYARRKVASGPAIFRAWPKGKHKNFVKNRRTPFIFTAPCTTTTLQFFTCFHLHATTCVRRAADDLRMFSLMIVTKLLSGFKVSCWPCLISYVKPFNVTNVNHILVDT